MAVRRADIRQQLGRRRITYRFRFPPAHPCPSVRTDCSSTRSLPGCLQVCVYISFSQSLPPLDRLDEIAMPDAPEMSVILCTAGYDHSIRFWEAWSGICHRQIALNQAWVSGRLYYWLLWAMKAPCSGWSTLQSSARSFRRCFSRCWTTLCPWNYEDALLHIYLQPFAIALWSDMILHVRHELTS